MPCHLLAAVGAPSCGLLRTTQASLSLLLTCMEFTHTCTHANIASSGGGNNNAAVAKQPLATLLGLHMCNPRNGRLCSVMQERVLHSHRRRG